MVTVAALGTRCTNAAVGRYSVAATCTRSAMSSRRRGASRRSDANASTTWTTSPNTAGPVTLAWAHTFELEIGRPAGCAFLAGRAAAGRVDAVVSGGSGR